MAKHFFYIGLGGDLNPLNALLSLGLHKNYRDDYHMINEDEPRKNQFTFGDDYIDLGEGFER